MLNRKSQSEPARRSPIGARRYASRDLNRTCNAMSDEGVAYHIGQSRLTCRKSKRSPPARSRVVAQCGVKRYTADMESPISALPPEVWRASPPESQALIVALQVEVRELRARLGQDSSNSSSAAFFRPTASTGTTQSHSVGTQTGRPARPPRELSGAAAA